jgi:MFS family permease
MMPPVSRDVLLPGDVDESRVAAVQRRTLVVVVAAQVLGGLGLAAGVSVGVLIARQLLDSALLAGLPLAAATAGGAAAAIGLSRVMARGGRRPGLVAGYLLGAVGSVGVVVAAQVESFPLLCLAMAVFGSGNVASLLARYAGADLAPAHSRGRALSLVLFATTFGAVAGPNLVGPTRRVAESLGLPSLTGPFLLAAVAYVLAAAVLAVLLRPDPLLLARERADGDGRAAAAAAVPVTRSAAGSWAAVTRGRAVLGLAAIAVAQFVMVLMMSMTPVHMADHGHGLGFVGFVIGAHIAGMYAFSPLAGWLTDRIGRVATVVSGAGALAAAGLLGGLAARTHGRR